MFSEYTNPSQTQEWVELAEHYKTIKQQHLLDFFAEKKNRANDYSYTIENLHIDLSKNFFNASTLDKLLNLANAVQLKPQIDAMFNGDDINITEQRPAMHWALRAKYDDLVLSHDTIAKEINNEFSKVELISKKIRSKSFFGSTDKAINTIVNIGIGGSDLGPRLVCEALKTFSEPSLNIHFVSNVDKSDLTEVLQQCNPETTLFIVASKSFSTLETKMNADSARNWILEKGCSDLSKHFIAITTNVEAAVEFGINKENILSFWSWVGGRYSLWSAIGLPIAISIGMDGFRDLLAGAAKIDNHFKCENFETNIPVLLALLDIWYRNFLQIETLAVVPYDHHLKLLPDYLSQLVMESNGKNIDRNGESIDYQTSPVIWGSVGTNAQHAFFQQLHQGTNKAAIDFLVGINGSYNDKQHQQSLYANCIAQSEALMVGQSDNAKDEPYRFFAGNRPSTLFVYEKFTPKILGMILAIYEHRTFVQGCIYNINSFDQWGVELGKKLSNTITDELSKKSVGVHDESTQNLLELFLAKQS